MTPGTGVLFDLTPGLEQEVRRRLSQIRRSKKVEGGRLVVGVAVPVRRPVLLARHPHPDLGDPLLYWYQLETQWCQKGVLLCFWSGILKLLQHRPVELVVSTQIHLLHLPFLLLHPLVHRLSCGPSNLKDNSW